MLSVDIREEEEEEEGEEGEKGEEAGEAEEEKEKRVRGSGLLGKGGVLKRRKREI